MINRQNNVLTTAGRKLALMQFLIMVLTVIICTSVSYILLGVSFAQSAFAGGVIGILPNGVFAIKAFRYAGAQASKKVVESFYSGVKLKLGLSVFLFALAFKFLVIIPGPFFTTYCLAVISSLLTPIFYRN
ncbi:ATP synthase subunit I [Thalassotalea sediminis]|uniref:ATP synthase subunit I n=1 Tax=Thalassotalea sediminis TaxID=1759089 RepID=UPI002572882D|nr:ATP synthase subunit I [Thalassotalea sediminis]